ncbi:MAG TPA: ATP phosphoribosyltransferase regulatory subunit [Polyangiales bacterium]|nr:ATP phosphoribosyltransferase regulatory subunit [Polyangiales bacterium]
MTESTAGRVARLSTLAHPLPAGMRDLLPAAARARAALARRLIESFELYGYERVTLPVFEYADVLERGLGSLDGNEVLRFVEPETGEVVALRPDMTPQVARLLATRLADAPPPARLCYEGSVLRRRRERARRHRQIPQAGIELLGRSGPAGDLEVLSTACAAVRAAGLVDYVLDLGHARIAGALLETAAPEQRPELVEALALKDSSELTRRAETSGMSGSILAGLAALPELSGGDEVWPRAERLLAKTPAGPAVQELRALWDAAAALGLAPNLVVDLGETWNFAYYTGSMFQILADGPGEAVGSGGRYDGLLERFGLPRAAAGFAIDLDNLAWALDRSGIDERAYTKVLISGADAQQAVPRGLLAELMAHLRGLGVPSAPAPDEAALAYCRAWRYSHLVEIGKESVTLIRIADEKQTRWPRAEAPVLASQIAAEVGAAELGARGES